MSLQLFITWYFFVDCIQGVWPNMKHSVQPSRGDDDGALAPFTVQQQMRYPEMQQQGYYLQSPPQQSQLSVGTPVSVFILF